MEIQTQNEKETRRIKKERPIYLRLERNVMAHSIEQVYDKIQVLHTKGLQLHRERYKTAGSYDKAQVQYLLDDIRAFNLDGYQYSESETITESQPVFVR